MNNSGVPTATVRPRNIHSLAGIVGKLTAALGMGAGLIVLLLFLAGVFHAKVPQDQTATSQPVTPLSAATFAEIRVVRRPQFEAAVGTVRAVHEAAVASKILARITSIPLKAGQQVHKGEVLATLDDSDLQARRKQAEAALAAAQATRDQASANYQRAKQLLGQNAISVSDYELARTALQTATADVARSDQLVREAHVLLDFATLRAPITGTVIDKKAEAGDTVMPGQVLLTLYDPTRMQMVASVRESLAMRLKVGQKLRGRLEALGYDCEATVSEIVPEAQAASRSFTVKVTGPCPPDVYTGMFGRIFIPLGEEEIVVVPAAAVTRVGQLDLVRVADNGGVHRRSVQLGRHFNGDVEVLAGLRPGERVVVATSSDGGRP